MVDQKIQELLNLNPKEKAEKEAIKEFGLTRDFREAGYILENGKLLDFSGKNDGGPSGTRAQDHREICRSIDTGDKGATGNECMETFLRRGNIRFSLTSQQPDLNVDLNTFQTPTKKQVTTLRNALGVCRNLNRIQGKGPICDLIYDVFDDRGNSCKTGIIERAPPRAIKTMLGDLETCKVETKSLDK